MCRPLNRGTKNKFNKNDSLLQLYFLTDFSYINTKTYKQEKPIGSELELHVYENKNEKIWWMLMGVGAGATIAGATTYLIMKFKQ